MGPSTLAPTVVINESNLSLEQLVSVKIAFEHIISAQGLEENKIMSSSLIKTLPGDPSKYATPIEFCTANNDAIEALEKDKQKRVETLKLHIAKAVTDMRKWMVKSIADKILPMEASSNLHFDFTWSSVIKYLTQRAKEASASDGKFYEKLKRGLKETTANYIGRTQAIVDNVISIMPEESRPAYVTIRAFILAQVTNVQGMNLEWGKISNPLTHPDLQGKAKNDAIIRDMMALCTNPAFAQEEQRVFAQEQTRAMANNASASAPGQGRPKRGSKPYDIKDKECFNCGKKGHFKAHCRKEGGGEFKVQVNVPPQPPAPKNNLKDDNAKRGTVAPSGHGHENPNRPFDGLSALSHRKAQANICNARVGPQLANGTSQTVSVCAATSSIGESHHPSYTGSLFRQSGEDYKVFKLDSAANKSIGGIDLVEYLVNKRKSNYIISNITDSEVKAEWEGEIQIESAEETIR